MLALLVSITLYGTTVLARIATTGLVGAAVPKIIVLMAYYRKYCILAINLGAAY